MINIYNWKEIDAKYKLGAKDGPEAVFKLIEKKGIDRLRDVLEELDGVYAFAYRKSNKIYLCRDLLGVKPLWYSTKDGLAFSSERKDLLKQGFAADEVEELDPRIVLEYDMKQRSKKLLKRKFFATVPAHKKTEAQIRKELLGLVVNAISKRLPDEKVGILFSGGIDSTLIAMVCKQLGIPFICYTAAVKSDGMKEAEDIVYARKVAKKLGFTLKAKVVTLKDAEKKLKEVVELIEDTNVVKVGVALPFYIACEQAKKDGVHVMFSGLGSEEIFAGYERHVKSSDVNKECVSGLLEMYKRDTYRDYVVAAHYGIDMRVPFLDKKLVDYALKIPAKYKLSDKQNKIIIRKVAEDLGVPNEFAERKKRAAQYGSNFDKAIKKLAKNAGYKFKSEYLEVFYQGKPRLGALFSSGKDSCYALHLMQRQGYPIACLISVKSSNPDSYMFHTPNIHLVELQAEAIGLPLVVQETAGEKEKELADLEKAITRAKKDYGIEGVVTGALYSKYQSDRIEKICEKLNLEVFSPLWHMDQEEEMRQLVKEGFEVVMSSIAAEGLDKNWLGRKLTMKDIDRLAALHKKIGFHVAGEGGEFESLVLDGPMFKKKIKITDSEIFEESENVARFVVKKAKLVGK